MKRPEDRVASPTNGHRPRLGHDDVDPDLAETTDLGGGTPNPVVPGLRPSVPSVTPTQALAGFGIIAAVILFLLRRQRGGGR
jgi:hypothetical protein